jgi:hypothetical protein
MVTVECDARFVLQILTIVFGGCAAGIAIWLLLKSVSLGGVIVTVFQVLFCALVIASELYVPEFYKYFVFLITVWGKGLMFFFIGFFICQRSGFGLFTALGCWGVCVFYVIWHFISAKASPPIFQKDNPPDFVVTSADYWDDGLASPAPLLDPGRAAPEPHAEPNTPVNPDGS